MEFFYFVAMVQNSVKVLILAMWTCKKSHLSKSATLELMGSEFHLVEMHKQNRTESYFVF